MLKFTRDQKSAVEQSLAKVRVRGDLDEKVRSQMEIVYRFIAYEMCYDDQDFHFVDLIILAFMRHVNRIYQQSGCTLTRQHYTPLLKQVKSWAKQIYTDFGGKRHKEHWKADMNDIAKRIESQQRMIKQAYEKPAPLKKVDVRLHA